MKLENIEYPNIDQVNRACLAKFTKKTFAVLLK